MNLFQEVRKACREVAVVITADLDDEILALRKVKDKKNRALHYLTAQQTSDKERLAELRHREFMENAAVESLENQLHSRQETKEFQQPICDLQSRLAATLSDIAARQNECKALETECQKLMSSNDSDLTEKIARKRREMDMYRAMSKAQWNYEAKPSEISGYISKSDDITTFEYSTNEHSRFYIINQLWKLM